MPMGLYGWISSSEAVHGSTAEKTFCSRMRRAINCVYCAPKSRMTIDWVSTLHVTPKFLTALPELDESRQPGDLEEVRGREIPDADRAPPDVESLSAHLRLEGQRDRGEDHGKHDERQLHNTE